MTDRVMMHYELAEIHVRRATKYAGGGPPQMMADISALLAEVERLLTKYEDAVFSAYDD